MDMVGNTDMMDTVPDIIRRNHPVGCFTNIINYFTAITPRRAHAPALPFYKPQ